MTHLYVLLGELVTPERVAEFESKLLPAANGCIIWTGGCVSRGYGAFYLNGKFCTTHRIAYELFIGPIQSGYYVCHTCDNPPCCNREHLFLGTAGDNARDKMKKGRGNRLDYPIEMLIEAEGLLKSGKTFDEVAESFRIKRSTLQLKLKQAGLFYETGT